MPRTASSSFHQAWEAVADHSGIGGGISLLDLGCGDGAFCAFASRRGAIVHGLDVEPNAIAEALEALPHADLRLGLMENLPWADASFDVVTSFNGVQYALDPELALVEAARVVRPSGRVAICKWGPPAGNEFFAFLASFGAGGVRVGHLPATDPVEDAIRASRLEVLRAADVPAPIELAGDAALATSLARAGVHADPLAPPGAMSVAEAAARYRQPDGTYRFENKMRFWILGRDR